MKSRSRNHKHPILLVASLLASVLIAVSPSAMQQVTAQSTTWSDTFDGSPSAPTPLIPAGWDIFGNGFDPRETTTHVPGGDSRGANLAGHGTACQAPPDGTQYNSNNANTHQMFTVADTVFQCSGHLMTSPGLAGYGAIYMSPPAMMDFSTSPSTLQFDVSTARTSSRDWWDIVLTPYADYNILAFNNIDQHIPANNIHIQLSGGGEVLLAFQRVAGSNTDVQFGADTSTSMATVLAANGRAESASLRDTFTVTLSATHLQVCMKNVSYQGHNPFCWVDNNLPSTLAAGVWHNNAKIQVNHHVYNAEKACIDNEPNPPANVLDAQNIDHDAYGDAHCAPNTWHWDSFSVAPAVRYTNIMPSGPQPWQVDFQSASAQTVNFPQAAPAGSMLEFQCICHSADFSNPHNYVAAEQVRSSSDGGATYGAWVPVTWLGPAQSEENGNVVLMSVPTGTNTIQVRGSNGFWGGYGVSGFNIHSPNLIGGLTPTPTPVPPTPTPTRTPTSVPNATSTPTPTGTPVPPTATATATTAPTDTPTPAPTNTPVPTATVVPDTYCAVTVMVHDADGNVVEKIVTKDPTFCEDV